jgi:hypothetical protein
VGYPHYLSSGPVYYAEGEEGQQANKSTSAGTAALLASGLGSSVGRSAFQKSRNLESLDGKWTPCYIQKNKRWKTPNQMKSDQVHARHEKGRGKGDGGEQKAINYERIINKESNDKHNEFPRLEKYQRQTVSP